MDDMHDIKFDVHKQTVCYCGLCRDESSSAEKAMRMPTPKQRNKHIQQVLAT
jgi:hypothetical protein